MKVSGVWGGFHCLSAVGWGWVIKSVKMIKWCGQDGGSICGFCGRGGREGWLGAKC